MPSHWLTPQTRFLVNPAGSFVIGGPVGDCGLTGRKIIVDTYGGAALPWRRRVFRQRSVESRSFRRLRCSLCGENIVAAGLASRCEVQLGWAIGLPRPVSVRINTFGTQTVSSEALLRGVNSHFDLSVFGIITTLDLLVPRYRKTACYGHFGRDSFPWEVTDKAALLYRRRWTLSRRRAAQLNLLQEKFMSGKSLGLIETVGMSGGGRSRRCRNEIR